MSGTWNPAIFQGGLYQTVTQPIPIFRTAVSNNTEGLSQSLPAVTVTSMTSESPPMSEGFYEDDEMLATGSSPPPEWASSYYKLRRASTLM